ncbi:MAG TPA: glycosyltransferase, partial [bacterium]|nr:glycosyltransferase [bacterium]
MVLRPKTKAGDGKICLLWHRFGPYHHARFKAAQGLMDVVGVEFSSVDPTYAWDRVDPKSGSKVVTLFHDRFSQEIPVREVRRRVDEVFSGLDPAAVAIPGWSDRAPLAALDWCLRRGIPAVLMSPSQKSDAPRVWYKEWPKQRIVRRFSAALVGGAPQKRYLSDLGFPGEKIFTGYNVVDNGHFTRGALKARKAGKALRKSLGLPDDYFVLSTRFVPKKNLERFLEAYVLYVKRNEGKPWSLVLLGDGPGRARLEKMVDERAARNFVCMPGFKQYNELPVYYGLANALALPSSSEQWGLVVNEAMAAGLPVLVSRPCGCSEDLVKDGENGYLLDPLDTDQMAAVLAKTSQAKKKLTGMGAKSLEIIDRWGPDAFAQGLSRAVEAARSAPRPSFGAMDR